MGIRERLERIEESKRAAAEKLRLDLAAASDKATARAVHAYRQGAESDTLFAAIGMTEETVARAVGALEKVDQEALGRRLSWVFCEVLAEPRRSRIQVELATLGSEEGHGSS